MKEIDATGIKLKCLRMVEGTDLEWWKVLRLHAFGNKHYFDKAPSFFNGKEDYELALGIVKGKPVFEGDELYNPYGKFTATIQDRGLNWSCCTWNPPKPKTIPVELPLETVEFMARLYFDDVKDHYQKVFSACRDALNKQTIINKGE